MVACFDVWLHHATRLFIRIHLHNSVHKLLSVLNVYSTRACHIQTRDGCIVAHNIPLKVPTLINIRSVFQYAVI